MVEIPKAHLQTDSRAVQRMQRWQQFVEDRIDLLKEILTLLIWQSLSHYCE